MYEQVRVSAHARWDNCVTARRAFPEAPTILDAFGLDGLYRLPIDIYPQPSHNVWQSDSAFSCLK